MFKKLFVAVAAAGAMTVPLAGVAWADDRPADGVGAHGVGKGGIPKAIGDAYPDQIDPRDRIPPGSEIRRAAKDDPEGSVPDYINHNTPFGRIGPGQLVKAYTPGHAPPPPQGGGSTVTPPPVSTPGTPDVPAPTTPETPAEPVPTPGTPDVPAPTTPGNAGGAGANAGNAGGAGDTAPERVGTRRRVGLAEAGDTAERVGLVVRVGLAEAAAPMTDVG